MKSQDRQSGFILPLLAVVVIIVSVAAYLYLKSPTIQKPPLVREVGEKLTDKANLDNWGKVPAEITITKDGFVPETITIMAGQQLTFVNQDKKVHRVIPSPPTTLKSLPEFDSEDLQPTDSFTYSFETIGKFTITDKKNSGKQATVIVN